MFMFFQEFQDLVSLNREFGLVAGTGNQIDVMPWITVKLASRNFSSNACIFPTMRNAVSRAHNFVC